MTENAKQCSSKYIPPHLRKTTGENSTAATMTILDDHRDEIVSKYVPPHLRNERTRNSEISSKKECLFDGFRKENRHSAFRHSESRRTEEDDDLLNRWKQQPSNRFNYKKPESCFSIHSRAKSQCSDLLDSEDEEQWNMFEKSFDQPPPNETDVEASRCTSLPQETDFLKMLENDYSENIFQVLLLPAMNLKHFLGNESISQSSIKVFLQVLLKSGENADFTTDFRKVLLNVLESDFSRKRIDHLISRELMENMDFELLETLISFLLLCFKIFPSESYFQFGVRINTLELIMGNMRLRMMDVKETVIHDFESLKEMCQVWRNSNKQSKGFRNRDVNDKGPPDDFRKLSAFPESDDFLIESKDIFLRRNKPTGIYQSVDDYLDIQYRLMREDFIQPLREGINTFKESTSKRIQDIRVYKNVKIVESIPSERSGITFSVSLDISSLRNVDWSQSKRLIHGSLLCLSNDNFQTILFATVSHRDVEKLFDGNLLIKFHGNWPNNNATYTMIESLNFFEGYHHVLQKLKQVNEDNLCFQDYIVFARNEIKRPAYLARNAALTYTVNGCRILPSEEDFVWPSAFDLKMDESQVRAFKAALTQELSIIQGPPGTGKTCLGLKICKCLLQNVCGHLRDFGPILIVCYTNHALDQFVEGIMKFTNKIVRIGSQSKSEKVQMFSLSNHRKLLTFKKNGIKSRVYSKLEDLYDMIWFTFRENEEKSIVSSKLQNLKVEIVDLKEKIKRSYKSVLPLNSLKLFISPSHFPYFEENTLINWLYGFSKQEDMNHDVEGDLYSIVNEEIEIQLWIIAKISMEESRKEKTRNSYSVWKSNIFNKDHASDNDATYLNNERMLDVDDHLKDVQRLSGTGIHKEAAVQAISFLKNKNYFQIVKSECTGRLLKRRLKVTSEMTSEELSAAVSLDSMTIEERWRMYRYWRSLYVGFINQHLLIAEHEYDEFGKQYYDLLLEEDIQIMERQDIVAMTTTGAARYGKMMEDLGCKIIIIEEAAEVLESHIISSLNSKCEHLILIGDHKQLKPNPSVYELAVRYKLDLSLFERLINNKLPFNMLEYQHRMRPEISEIMNFIYKDLKNHEIVYSYPNVVGVGRNVFFFNHTEPEIHDVDSLSYSNRYEADFMKMFCKRLLKNGIKGVNITILTLYSGQLSLLKRLMVEDIFKDVRICVVDNFQGEENEIILLSLVRSNESNTIGFLNIENRVCVSLSRAKHGFYAVGNFEMLSNRNELWNKICVFMKDQGKFGNKLLLKCQNHPEKELWVEKTDDFLKYPEGGCEVICGESLLCGHSCRLACHSLDRNHKEYQCDEDCVKFCKNGHKCKNRCWENCGNCRYLVRRCCNDCDHEDDYECWDEDFLCKRVCEAILECGHKCRGSCGKCFNGRLHSPCKKECTTDYFCGHRIQFKCCDRHHQCTNVCVNGCDHVRCLKKCLETCDSCNKPCSWRCIHKQCSRKCFEICDRDYCNELCCKFRTCETCQKKFRCYGVCGEFCESVCVNCNEEMTDQIVKYNDRFITLRTCGHTFPVLYMDEYMESAYRNGVVAMKKCPKCGTVISKRTCFRYSKIVANIYKDVEKIKISILKRSERTDGSNLSLGLYKKVFDFYQNEECYKRLQKLYEAQLSTRSLFILFKYNDEIFDERIPVVQKCLQQISETHRKVFGILQTGNNDDLYFAYLKRCMSKLLTWISDDCRTFSEFELNQLRYELRRIDLMILLLQTSFGKQSPLDQKTSLFDLKNLVGMSGECEEYFQKLKERISETELERIRMQFPDEPLQRCRPEWSKCNNGHVYQCKYSIVGVNCSLCGK